MCAFAAWKSSLIVCVFVLRQLGAEMPHAVRAAAPSKRLFGPLVVVDEVNCDVVVVVQQSVPNHVLSQDPTIVE